MGHPTRTHGGQNASPTAFPKKRVRSWNRGCGGNQEKFVTPFNRKTVDENYGIVGKKIGKSRGSDNPWQGKWTKKKRSPGKGGKKKNARVSTKDAELIRKRGGKPENGNKKKRGMKTVPPNVTKNPSRGQRE